MSEGHEGGANVWFWVSTAVGRQAEICRLNGSCDQGEKGTTVIIEHFSPDAYGLLILAPEIALGSGWLGGDRVVGRAAIRDLLIKAARFNEHERRRLTIYLPSRTITPGWTKLNDTVERNTACMRR